MVGTRTFYDFELPALKGGMMDLKGFEGQLVLVVNTASECGFTGQYAQLQELHEQYSDKVAIIACPSNDFGGQEPGSEDEIASFCQVNYGVGFPMSAKLKVKGADRHPLYEWLVKEAQAKGLSDEAEVSWNFQKYLIDERGQLKAVFPPNVTVFDEALLSSLGISL